MKKTTHYLLALSLLLWSSEVQARETTLPGKYSSHMSQSDLNTAFAEAVKRNQPEKVRELIKAGADVKTLIRGETEIIGSWECYTNYTPLSYSMEHRFPELVRIFLDISDPYDALINAISYNYFDLLDELIEKGADINRNGYPLTAAIRKGHIEIVKKLIERGADINYGGKPLNTAISNNRIDIAKLLIELGADINYVDSCEDSSKETPLNIAASCGCLEIVKELLKRGVNIEHEDENKNTPLLSAVIENHIEVVETLLKADANINHENADKNTPLLIAAKKNDRFILETLINAGADIYHTDIYGRTCLMEAVLNDNLYMVKKILEIAKINEASFTEDQNKIINIADNDGNTAFILSAKIISFTNSRDKFLIDKRFEILNILLETDGIDLLHTNKKGENAISLLADIIK